MNKKLTKLAKASLALGAITTLGLVDAHASQQLNYKLLGSGEKVRSAVVQMNNSSHVGYFADAAAAGGDAEATHAKGAEGKCGEGKCGAKKKKAHEGKCGADKKKGGEGKCGAEKKAAAEGKCGANKKAAEGKCGANKAEGAAHEGH